MKAECWRLDALSPGDVAAWNDLVGRALEPNPFAEPGYVLPAACHLGQRDHLGLLVAVEAGTLYAALPVRHADRRPRYPRRALVAWRHDYCFLGTPLLDRSRAAAAIEALGAALGEDGLPDFLAIELCSAPVARLMDGALGRRVVDRSWSERATVERHEEERFTPAVSGRHRRELRRLRRALERATSADATPVDASPDVVERFLTLEAAGWKGRSGGAMAARPGHADFFREMCAEFARQHRLWFKAVGARTTPAAMVCGLDAPPHAYTLKVAYDEALSRFSPGVHIMNDGAARLDDNASLTMLDSCADPLNDMINRVWPNRRSLTTLIVASDATIPKAVMSTRRLVSRVANAGGARR